MVAKLPREIPQLEKIHPDSLLGQLIVAGIVPFSEQSVIQHKKQMLLNNPPSLMYRLWNEVEIFGASLEEHFFNNNVALTMVSTLFVLLGFLGTVGAASAISFGEYQVVTVLLISAALLFFGSLYLCLRPLQEELGFITLRGYAYWDWYHLSEDLELHKNIPAEIKQLIGKIRSIDPTIALRVEVLRQNRVPLDPFLYIETERNRYYIAQWDEKGFDVPSITQ